MIHYHGGPITPETCAVVAWSGRHAFCSFDHRAGTARQIETAAAICQSFALDNGAFPAWTRGEPVTDWAPFYAWAARWLTHPACDWAVIPDVIGGTEAENDALVREWPLGFAGVPVWHLNESIDRLVSLADDWPRVALGSAAEYDVKSPRAALDRLAEALPAISDADGRPLVKLHGLRMLRPEIVERVPLASADSTNLRNAGFDLAWKGTYQPATKEARVMVLVDRMESHNAPDRMLWSPAQQLDVFALEATP